MGAIMIPRHLTKPHPCLLSCLKQIQNYYDGKHITMDIFDEWMSLNSDIYQLGNSRASMLLWNSFTRFHRDLKKIKEIDKETIPANKRIYSLNPCKIHKVQWVSINYSAITNKSEVDVFDEIWQYSSSADKGKTNVSASDLIWHISKQKWAVDEVKKWEPYLSIGLHNVTICSLLIHAIGNDHAYRILDLMKRYKLCCLSNLEYPDVFKALSVALRRTGYWPNGERATLEEVTSCAHWELSLGRSGNVSDWVTEKKERTAAPLHLSIPIAKDKSYETTAYYNSYLEEELIGIHRELIRAPQRGVSWESYIENRQSWCSSGSTGGQRITLKSGERVRLNKHAYFEKLTKEEMIAWLDEPPRIIATASEKYEMGKSRAIYGTEVRDYTICSYALDQVEPSLHRVNGIESGLLGLDYLATMIRRSKAVSSEDNECTMIDYANFNLQHPLTAQALVFSTLAEALQRQGHHPDKVKAAQWVSSGLLNQWCKFPQDQGRRSRIIQGMFSGCRGTNYINTLLNLAYFRVASRWVYENLSLVPRKLYNIHQGDDVWISNGSRLWAQVLFDSMRASGFIFQPSKQMFDRGRGEFLRIVYTEDGCRGYLARSVGTLIVKPIQATDVLGPAERAVALNSQVMVLRRRGLSRRASTLLWNAIVPYAARSKLPSGSVTIPVPYLNKHHIDGGLDLGPPHTAAKRSRTVAHVPPLALGSSVLESELPSNMAKDWANGLSRSLKYEIDFDSLVESLHRTNMSDSLRPLDRLESLRNLEIAIRKWKEKLDCGVVIRDTPTYEKLAEGDCGPSCFEQTLGVLVRNELGKNTPGQENPVACVLQAVAASPFKSVSNAVTATGNSELEALLLAVRTCPNVNLMIAALGIVSSLRNYCNDEVTLAVVTGMGAGATKYECELHPVVLSWIQTWAMKSTLSHILQTRTLTTMGAKEALATELDKHIRSVRKFKEVIALSHY